MKTPHKHAELIKAWADGAEIEYFSKTTLEWCLITVPTWADNAEFRVKPEPKPDVVYYGVFDEAEISQGRRMIDSCFTSMNDIGDQIKIVFDGETGKLKSAEVL